MEKTEVEHYLSDDRITCLECGRSFVSLGHHIGRAHGLSPRQYKEKHGLPLQRALCTPAMIERHRELCKKKPHWNKNRRSLNELLGGRGERSKKQQTSQYRDQLVRETKWRESDFREYQRRIVEDGRFSKEVGKDPDMPSESAYRKWKRKGRRL